MELNKKTLYLGGGVAAVAVLLFIASRQSSANSGGGGGYITVPTGPSDAQLAAAAQINMGNLQLRAKSMDNEAAIMSVQLQTEGALAAKALDAGLARYAIDADSARADTAARLSREAIASQERTQITGMDLGAKVAKYTLDQQYASQVANNAFQLDYAETAGNISLELARTQVDSLRDISNGQNQVRMFEIGAGRDVALTSIYSNRDVNLAMIDGSIEAQRMRTDLVSASLPSLKKNNRDDILQAYLTGQTFDGNRDAATIGAVGDAAANIGKAIASFF